MFFDATVEVLDLEFKFRLEVFHRCEVVTLLVLYFRGELLLFKLSFLELTLEELGLLLKKGLLLVVFRFTGHPCS